MAPPVLAVSGLRTHFFTRDGVVKAVDGVSLSLARGETLGLVGESGCGKSITALSILRLVPSPPGRIVEGSVRFDGTELLTLDPAAMRAIRGNRISMIFQEPMTSLNPVMTVGRQIAETVALHQRLPRRAAMDRAIEMLALVKIPDTRRRAAEYPHQLSGGMRQRVMIAIAMACTPTILIADEPTTALDVTIQAQILDLMLEMKERTGAAVMLITHDLGVIAETAQRVVVMYAGRKVEEASTRDLFARPRHPYTRGLMTSIPRLNRDADESARATRLTEIPGMVPALINLAPGCTYAPRCAYATGQCRIAFPPEVEAAPGHVVACWNAESLPEMERA
ncbi:MAG: ABC transporter ATP-binding protein [Betaproteobacteria bacterium]|nr:ABC transporter ATP-binding protein [Betaproteobacteria bacterium]